MLTRYLLTRYRSCDDGCDVFGARCLSVCLSGSQRRTFLTLPVGASLMVSHTDVCSTMGPSLGLFVSSPCDVFAYTAQISCGRSRDTAMCLFFFFFFFLNAFECSYIADFAEDDLWDHPNGVCCVPCATARAYSVPIHFVNCQTKHAREGGWSD